MSLLGDRKFAYTFLLIRVSKKRQHKLHFCVKHNHLYVEVIYEVKSSACMHLLKSNQQLVIKQLFREMDKSIGVGRYSSVLVHSTNTPYTSGRHGALPVACCKVGSELHPISGIITVPSNVIHVIHVVVRVVFCDLQKSKTLHWMTAKKWSSCASSSPGFA